MLVPRRLLPIAPLVTVLFLLPACHPLLPPTYPPLHVPPPPIQEFRLDNGLRLFVVERHTAPTFAAVSRFDAGGVDDPRSKSGIAHLVEHMMFKGTRDLGALDPKREALLTGRLDGLWRALYAARDRARRTFQPKDPSRTGPLVQQINALTTEYRGLTAPGEYDALLDRIGAVGANASTSHDSTTYQVQLPANRLDLWFRIESDRLLHPSFRDFYTERDVVREERRRHYESQPESMLIEELYSLLFSAHPYGTPVIGWPGDIEHLHREDALTYFQAYYTPARCTMVIVGDVRAAEVERLARRYLGAWRPGPQTELAPRHTTPEPEQRGERRRVVELDAAPRLLLGWVTVAEGHPDQAPLEVLARIVGGMTRSRLTRGLGGILGGGSASHHAFATAGFFRIRVRANEWRWVARWQEAHVKRVLQNIRETGVTAAELARAKHDLQNDFLPGLDGHPALAERIAEAAAGPGGLRSLEDYPRRIAAVTVDQVQMVARRYLRPERKCVVELRRPARKSARVPASPPVAPAVPSRPAPQDDGAPQDALAMQEPPSARRPVPKTSGAPTHSSAFMAALADVAAAPPLRPARPELGKDIERVVLPSGITLFLHEDHSQPTVSLQFWGPPGNLWVDL